MESLTVKILEDGDGRGFPHKGLGCHQFGGVPRTMEKLSLGKGSPLYRVVDVLHTPTSAVAVATIIVKNVEGSPYNGSALEAEVRSIQSA